MGEVLDIVVLGRAAHKRIPESEPSIGQMFVNGRLLCKITKQDASKVSLT